LAEFKSQRNKDKWRKRVREQSLSVLFFPSDDDACSILDECMNMLMIEEHYYNHVMRRTFDHQKPGKWLWWWYGRRACSLVVPVGLTFSAAAAATTLLPKRRVILICQDKIESMPTCQEE